VKINIVSPHSGWILDFIAQRIINTNKKMNTGIEMQRYFNPRNDVDINYYIDVYNCYWGKTEIKDVGYLTGFHEGFIPTRAMDLDFIVFQNQKYRKEMIGYGYPKEKTRVIYPGVFFGMFPLKKITIGIFQKGTHRDKGHDFLLDLLRVMDLNNFRFLFVGEGWDDVVRAFLSKEIEARQFKGDNYSKYSYYYDLIDFLLVPSLVEGGPISVLEALAKGIPIIASKVGFVGDFDVEYVFEPGDVFGLAKILMNIEKTRLNRREKVKNLTWQNHVRELIKVFEGIK